MIPKKKKKDSKNKNLNTNLFANLLKKSLETKLKKLWFLTESLMLLASSSPVNTDGLPIWKESWKLKP